MSDFLTNITGVYGVAKAKPDDNIYGNRGYEWEDNIFADKELTEKYNGLADWKDIKAHKTYKIVSSLDVSEYQTYTDAIKDENPAVYYVTFTATPASGKGYVEFINANLGEDAPKNPEEFVEYSMTFYDMNPSLKKKYDSYDEWAKSNFQIRKDVEYSLYKEVDEEFLNNYYGIQPKEEEVLPKGTFYVNGVLYEPGITHTVRSGEKLGDIASEYGFTIEDIKAANPEYYFGKDGVTIYDVEGRNELRIPQLYVAEEHQTYTDVNGNPYKIYFPGWLNREDYSLYAQIVEPLCYFNDGKLPREPHDNYTTLQNALILKNQGGMENFALDYNPGNNTCAIRFKQKSTSEVYTAEQLADLLGCDANSINISSSEFMDGTTHYYFNFSDTLENPIDIANYPYRYPTDEIIVPEYVTFGITDPDKQALAVQRYSDQVLVLKYLGGGNMPTTMYRNQEEFDAAVSLIQDAEILECLNRLGKYGSGYQIANTYVGLQTGELAVGYINGQAWYRYTPSASTTDYMEYLSLIGCEPNSILENDPSFAYDVRYFETDNYHLGDFGKFFGLYKLKPFARRENAEIRFRWDYGAENVAGVGNWHDEEWYSARQYWQPYKPQ